MSQHEALIKLIARQSGSSYQAIGKASAKILTDGDEMSAEEIKALVESVLR